MSADSLHVHPCAFCDGDVACHQTGCRIQGGFDRKRMRPRECLECRQRHVHCQVCGLSLWSWEDRRERCCGGDGCLGFLAGRDEMARAFWAAVCEQRAQEADVLAQPRWYQDMADEHTAEAAQLRAWAKEGAS